MPTRTEGHRSRRWRDMSGAEKYAFIQSQVLFWALYGIAFYLVATNLGFVTAAFVFGGGIVVAAVGTIFGLRLRRRRNQ